MKKKVSHQVFLNLFSNIHFNVNSKPIQKQVSIEIMQSTENELLKTLAAAKKDLSKAKRLHKQNRISTDELFDWEWKVQEIVEELARMREEIDDLNDLNDLKDNNLDSLEE